MPDFVRSVGSGATLTLRYPDATLPWQRVPSLVHGYLMLIAKLVGPNSMVFVRAWNLGSAGSEAVLRARNSLMGNAWKFPLIEYMNNPLPEAGALALGGSIARNLLGWIRPWDTPSVIGQTANWYQAYAHDRKQVRAITLAQIEAYRRALAPA